MKRPAWFVVATIVLILWSAMGVFACIQQFRLGADAMGPASQYDRDLYARLPIWYNAVYAVAVGTGLLGGLALLFRSVLAIPLFALSLVAVVIQFGWLFAATDIIAVKGLWVTYFPLAILAIGAFSLWLARLARARRWIG
jgi:hypothetical protein